MLHEELRDQVGGLTVEKNQLGKGYKKTFQGIG